MGSFRNLWNKMRSVAEKADNATKDYVANAEGGLKDARKMENGLNDELTNLRTQTKVEENDFSKLKERLVEIEKTLTFRIVITKKKKEAGDDVTAEKGILTKLVEEKKSLITQIESKRGHVDTLHSNITRMTRKRDEMRSKIRHFESTLSSKKAEITTAQMTQKLNAAADAVDSGNPFSAFDDLSKKVEMETAKAEVSEEDAGTDIDKIIEETKASNGSSAESEVDLLLG